MKLSFSRFLFIVPIVGALSACGGSSGSGSTASSILSGTAAAGAAIIGQVTVKGSAGNSISTNIETDGSYSVDVSSLVAPYMLRAEGRVGGKDYTLHSFAEEADVGETVNITPFTDLIIANAASDLASDYFDDGNFSSLTSEEIDAQETALQEKLANVFDALGIDSAIDLLHSNFSADHSGLDAALDIIRIETDPDTDIATITNFIDGQSIEDDISQTDDVVAPLPVDDAQGLSTAQIDLMAMANKVSSLSALFGSGLPSSNQLNALFAEDTLDYDVGKSQLITELSTDPSLVGISFSNVTYEDYNQEAGTSIIQLSVIQNGVVDSERWHMAKNEGVWQFRGNQEIADVWFVFNCNYSPTYGSPGCGVNVGVEDNDFSNTPGAADTPIASAKMTIIRDGEAVENSEIHLGVPSGYSAGELVIYDEDYGDDYMGFGSTWSEIPASVFHAGDTVQIELFTEVLDISSAQDPQIDQSATPVQVVTRTVIAAPVSDASVSSFPSVNTATLTALAQYTNGDLDVEWTVPIGLTIDEVWLEARQGSNDVQVDDENLEGSNDTTTIALDTSSLNTSENNFTKELRIYANNSNRQTFLTMYHYEGIEVIEPPEEPVVSNLIGTWEVSGGDINSDGYNGTFLTLIETGEFFFFNRDEGGTETCREFGYEYGRFTIDNSEINLRAEIDTNGCVGLFDDAVSETLVLSEISTNTVTFYSEGESEAGSLTMQRVVLSDDSIIGAWHEPLDSVDGNGLSLILLFLEDSTFYIMDANPDDPTENDFSIGDYEFDASNDELTLTDLYNTPDSQNEGVNVLDVVIVDNEFIIDGNTTDPLNRVGESSSE